MYSWLCVLVQSCVNKGLPNYRVEIPSKVLLDSEVGHTLQFGGLFGQLRSFCSKGYMIVGEELKGTISSMNTSEQE